MTSKDDLRLRLGTIATDIEHWRNEANRLRAAAKLPSAASDDALLLSVEEISGGIYRGIETFDELVVDVDRKSHVAAGQVAELGDALRLMLLEITEIGTGLYSLRQGGDMPNELIEFAISANGDRWLLSPAAGDSPAFVEHRANEPSGGSITRTAITVFLAEKPAGPQHGALRQLLEAESIDGQKDGQPASQAFPR